MEFQSLELILLILIQYINKNKNNKFVENIYICNTNYQMKTIFILRGIIIESTKNLIAINKNNTHI